MDYKFRMYSPLLGRFISPDSITPDMTQGLNRYSYVVNNPVRFNDPTGHIINPPCILCDISIDFSNITGLLNKAIDVLSTLGCVFAGCHVDRKKDVITGPTRQEAMNTSIIGMVNPIGLPTSKIATSIKTGASTLSDEIGEFIYRKASGAADSVTPRAGIDDLENGGLSFYNTLKDMSDNLPMNSGDKYIKVDLKKLDGLEVILDNNPPGHVIVRPPTLGALREWASTKGTGIVHKFTETIMNNLYKLRW